MTALTEHPAFRLVEAFRKHASGQPDYVNPLLPHLKVVEITESTAADHYRNPRIVFEYTVQPEHCNSMKNLHGGAIATLFDFCTSLVGTLGGADNDDTDKTDKTGDPDNTDDMFRVLLRMGVSRTLAVTYLRPAPCGTPLLVDCEVLHAGRRLSSLRALLRRRSDGAVLASCEHGKVQSKI